MDFTTKETSLSKIKNLFDEYISTLTGVTGDYWEEYILNSGFFSIEADGKDVGFYAACNEVDTRILTLFYLKKDYCSSAKTVFKKIIKNHRINRAYAATCDKLFLSLCLENQKKIKVQAFFYNENRKEDNKVKYNRSCLMLASVCENCKTGDVDFDNNIEKNITDKISIYNLTYNGRILGYGLIIPCRLRTRYRQIYTMVSDACVFLKENEIIEAGSSIIKHLSDLCRENGTEPIAGCWDFKDTGKKIIENSGFYPSEKLLNISF